MSKAIVNDKKKLFFSHSAKDKELVQHLVEAASIGLDLRRVDIMSTSIDGFGVRAGEDILKVVKTQGIYSNCLIGIITPNSLKSHWVMFELGARWGSGNPFAIILANGADYDDIPEVIRYNLAKKCVVTDLESLFLDVSEVLGLQFHNLSVKGHLQEAELLSKAEAQRNFDKEFKKPTVRMKMSSYSAEVEIISPKKNKIIYCEYNYEIKQTYPCREGNTLWLCHEVAGKIWPKKKLEFVKNIASGTEREGGDPSQGAWSLYVIEVDSIGDNEIEEWFKEAKYPGITEINGALIGCVELILKK